MFESASWTTINRRNFAVVEHLYEQVDRPIGDIASWSDDPEFSALLAYKVGSPLLRGSISVGTSSLKKFSKRRERAAWKKVSPGTGARACVYLTLATAAMLSKELEPEVDPAIADPAKEIFRRGYEPLAKDLEAIETVRQRVIRERTSQRAVEATERGGMRPSMVTQYGQAILSYQALELAGAEPAGMEAFEFVADLDQEHWSEIYNFEWTIAATIKYAIYWRRAKEAFLEVAESRFE